MKTELRRPKTLLGIFLALTLAFSLTMTAPVMAQVTFTGNVETDFPASDPFVFIVPDPDGRDVFVRAHPVANTTSGWDIKDVRLRYDPASDVLHVGLNSYETVGDADTDGNEGFKSYGEGVDIPDLGPGEYVAVYFDLDQNGNWDVIAGVPSAKTFSGFMVNTAVGNTSTQAFFGLISLSADHLGDRFWRPALGPANGDLEFEIRKFSLLPGQDGQLGSFTVGANMGSVPDVDIKEDLMTGSVSLFITPPVGGTALPVDKLGLLAPWAVLLGCAGILALVILRRRRHA